MPSNPAASRAEVITIHDQADAEYAAVARMEVDDYRKKLREHLATLLDQQELRIRMKPSDLERWLGDGERLTFHTTGITNGREDIEARCAVEHTMMGVPLDAGEEDRPRYGYLRGSSEYGNVLNGYGNVLVRLSDDLRAHTTVVLGDSMGSATPVPSIPVGWVCMVAEPLDDVEGLLCRYPDQDVARATRLYEACHQKYQYAEVQIYDPLLPRSIRQVIFCNGEPAPRDLRITLGNWGIDLDEIPGVLD